MQARAEDKKERNRKSVGKGVILLAKKENCGCGCVPPGKEAKAKAKAVKPKAPKKQTK
jgi:hypothetical protein